MESVDSISGEELGNYDRAFERINYSSISSVGNLLRRQIQRIPSLSEIDFSRRSGEICIARSVSTNTGPLEDWERRACLLSLSGDICSLLRSTTEFVRDRYSSLQTNNDHRDVYELDRLRSEYDGSELRYQLHSLRSRLEVFDQDSLKMFRRRRQSSNDLRDQYTDSGLESLRDKPDSELTERRATHVWNSEDPVSTGGGVEMCGGSITVVGSIVKTLQDLDYILTSVHDGFGTLSRTKNQIGQESLYIGSNGQDGCRLQRDWRESTLYETPGRHSMDPNSRVFDDSELSGFSDDRRGVVSSGNASSSRSHNGEYKYSNDDFRAQANRRVMSDERVSNVFLGSEDAVRVCGRNVSGMEGDNGDGFSDGGDSVLDRDDAIRHMVNNVFDQMEDDDLSVDDETFLNTLQNSRISCTSGPHDGTHDRCQTTLANSSITDDIALPDRDCDNSVNRRRETLPNSTIIGDSSQINRHTDSAGDRRGHSVVYSTMTSQISRLREGRNINGVNRHERCQSLGDRLQLHVSSNEYSVEDSNGVTDQGNSVCDLVNDIIDHISENSVVGNDTDTRFITNPGITFVTCSSRPEECDKNSGDKISDTFSNITVSSDNSGLDIISIERYHAKQTSPVVGEQTHSTCGSLLGRQSGNADSFPAQEVFRDRTVDVSGSLSGNNDSIRDLIDCIFDQMDEDTVGLEGDVHQRVILHGNTTSDNACVDGVHANIPGGSYTILEKRTIQSDNCRLDDDGVARSNTYCPDGQGNSDPYYVSHHVGDSMEFRRSVVATEDDESLLRDTSIADIGRDDSILDMIMDIRHAITSFRPQMGEDSLHDSTDKAMFPDNVRINTDSHPCRTGDNASVDLSGEHNETCCSPGERKSASFHGANAASSPIKSGGNRADGVSFSNVDDGVTGASSEGVDTGASVTIANLESGFSQVGTDTQPISSILSNDEAVDVAADYSVGSLIRGRRATDQLEAVFTQDKAAGNRNDASPDKICLGSKNFSPESIMVSKSSGIADERDNEQTIETDSQLNDMNTGHDQWNINSYTALPSPSHSTDHTEINSLPAKDQTPSLPEKMFTDTEVVPSRPFKAVEPSGTEVISSRPGIEVIPSGPDTEVVPSRPDTVVVPSRPDTVVVPSRTETVVVPSRPATEVEPNRLDTEMALTKHGTEVVPSRSDTEVVPSGPDTGVVPSGPDTEVVPSGPDTEVVPSGPVTVVVPSRHDTEVLPRGPDTEVLPSGPGTDVVPSRPGTGVVPSRPGTVVVPSRPDMSERGKKNLSDQSPIGSDDLHLKTDHGNLDIYMEVHVRTNANSAEEFRYSGYSARSESSGLLSVCGMSPRHVFPGQSTVCIEDRAPSTGLPYNRTGHSERSSCEEETKEVFSSLSYPRRCGPGIREPRTRRHHRHSAGTDLHRCIGNRNILELWQASTDHPFDAEDRVPERSYIRCKHPIGGSEKWASQGRDLSNTQIEENTLEARFDDYHSSSTDDESSTLSESSRRVFSSGSDVVFTPKPKQNEPEIFQTCGEESSGEVSSRQTFHDPTAMDRVLGKQLLDLFPVQSRSCPDIILPSKTPTKPRPLQQSRLHNQLSAPKIAKGFWCKLVYLLPVILAVLALALSTIGTNNCTVSHTLSLLLEDIERNMDLRHTDTPCF